MKRLFTLAIETTTLMLVFLVPAIGANWKSNNINGNLVGGVTEVLHLNEGSGTATRMEVSNGSATVAGATWITTPNSYGLRFTNVTSEGVTLNNTGGLDLFEPTNSFSIVQLYRIKGDTDPLGMVFSKTPTPTGGNQGFYMQWTSCITGDLAARWFSGGGVTTQKVYPATVQGLIGGCYQINHDADTKDKWHIVAFVYKSTGSTQVLFRNCVFYIDNIIFDQIGGDIGDGVSFGSVSNTSNWAIGHAPDWGSSPSINGDVDETLVFNRALSAGEMREVDAFLKGRVSSAKSNSSQ